MKRTIGYFIFFLLVLCLLASISQALTIYSTVRSGGDFIGAVNSPDIAATNARIVNLSASNFAMTGTSSGNFPKMTVYDHGAKNADYTLDLSLADMHVVSFTAASNLTISSSRTNDKAMVVVKSGGAYNVNLKGVDNGATNLTAAANTQDLLGFTKAFGKITLGASALNYPTN